MLYHLISPKDWESVEGQSYSPESLKTEGFIHLSTKDQFQKTYQRYFLGQEMLVLEIDETKLKAKLKYETNDHGEFPHLYGPLNLDAVVHVNRVRDE